MSIDTIRKHIDEAYDGLPLLDSLLAPDSVKWVPFNNKAANPPKGIVLGQLDEDYDILAFLVQLGDKPREIKYVAKKRQGGDQFEKTLSQDDVVQRPLDSPFRYNANLDKASKRKFSIVIKWYFLCSGNLKEINGDYKDYSKRLFDALRKIDAGQRAEEGKSHIEPVRNTPSMHEEDSESEEPKNSYHLRSTQDTEHGETETRVARSSSLASMANMDDNKTDYQVLCESLEDHGVSHLLRNLPELGHPIEFFDNDKFPDALPKKLFLGREVEWDGGIFAYMRQKGSNHEVHFNVEYPPRSSLIARPISSKDIAKERIHHPFNKVYPKESSNRFASEPLDQSSRYRLTLIVKWYFVKAGIANDIVIRENKQYPDRLRSALEYIARRMGKASVKAPSGSGPSRSGTPAESINTQTFDETGIQSSLTSTAPPVLPPSSRPESPLPNAKINEAPAPRSAPNPAKRRISPRGTKRPLEESDDDEPTFENLRRTLNKTETLTKQMSSVAAELDTMQREQRAFVEAREARRMKFTQEHELRYQEFLNEEEERAELFFEEWRARHDVVDKKRLDIEAQRSRGWKKIKRLSHAHAEI
ncbi:hypothetical protein GQ44DRAFT_716778 [Phaeosphaeriaceae sp. PMI808]|nr:hypothetical protein GQ44DRAFT_716778 [Phaeosphaeriaceae sp. PMI808]